MTPCRQCEKRLVIVKRQNTLTRQSVNLRKITFKVPGLVSPMVLGATVVIYFLIKTNQIDS